MKIETDKIIAILRWPMAENKGVAKYQSIYNGLKQAILTNDLPDGSELPPTRMLAKTMGVSRSTIIRVYELLKLEGLLDANIGSGHLVHSPVKLEESNLTIELSNHAYVALSETGLAIYKNRKRINSTDDPGIAFRPGVPPLDLFPVAKWKKLSNEYWQFIKASELSYYAGAGVEVLRKTIANYLNLRRNVKCHYQQVFVVSGSLQSLYLIGNLLLNPSDEVLVENPTFPNVQSVFKGMRAQVTGIGLDESGLDVTVLEKKVSAQSKLLHVTPSCHYPLGMQMPDTRKEEVLALADKRGLYIIENDYENEVNYPNHNGHPLFSIDTQDRTFYLGTFNRILHPSIRVGFVVVPKHLSAHFHALLMHSHRFVSPTTQVVLGSFIEKKFLHDHLKQVIQVAAERHEIFNQLLKEELSQFLEPIPFHQPSLHVTALIKNGYNDETIVAKLAQNGIIAHALSKCFVQSPKKHGLIFGYASIKPQHMPPIIKKMAKVMRGS